MDATLAALAGGAVGDVRLGAFSTAIRGLIVPVVGAAARAPPGRCGPSCATWRRPEIFDAIALGDLDLGISMDHSRAPSRDDERFARFDLMRDILDVALPADHPLRRRATSS